MNIGVIGSGHIGSVVGTLFAKAGHTVLFSSRHPETLENLVHDAGHNARAGSVEAAARFGDVILLSVPFHVLPELGPVLAPLIAGKIVLETANPYPDRDGPMAQDVIDSKKGTGPSVLAWLPGARLVRGFNSVWDQTLIKEAHRNAPQVGIPLASDDTEALRIVEQLVRDSGFDPVFVGTLDQSKRFDTGTPVYNTGMSGPEVRAALHVA